MEIGKVGVVGLGTMGAGIAQVSVAAGHETVGREVSPELAERGRDRIAHFLGRAVEKGRTTAAERDAALGRLTLTQDLADFADCDLVIEAVLEELPLKREVFAELLRHLAPDGLEAGLDADLRKAGAHRPEADDADLANLHGSDPTARPSRRS